MAVSVPNLTLVIDRTLYRPHPEDDVAPLSLVEAAIAGGVTMIQLRLSLSSREDLAVDAIAHRLREISLGRVPFLVTSSLELAERCRADGVMLAEDFSYHPTAAKNYLRAPGGTIVGCYADSVASASRAERGGADFVQVATRFDSSGAEVLGLVRKIRDAIHLPLIAFGGIESADRAGAAIASGASGVAVTRAILEAPDPRAATQAIFAAMSK
jgi:thiamine-phosphate pyrophosphorylase